MQLVRQLGVRGVLLFLVVFAPWLMAAQCWSKVQSTTIPVTIEKSIDLDEVDISQYTGDFNKKYPIKDGKIPAGAPDLKIPIDIKDKLDISNDPNIQKYGTKVVGIVIVKMETEVLSNSVNINIPRIDIKMGAIDKEPTTLIGYLSGIPAAKKPKENIIKDSAGRKSASDLFTKFAFTFGASTNLVAKAGTPVPKGKLKLRINFKVTFQIQPLKK